MDTTVLISSSPIISHPSTEMIDEVIKSVRDRLPGVRIIIMLDGVREEQSRYKKNYEKYIENLDPTVEKMVFKEFRHQAAMTIEAIQTVTTSTILFLEHDTPLTGDIPFKDLLDIMDTYDVNLIRFHYEAFIPEVHKHLMLGEPQLINNTPLLRTAQWSQRPHLANVEFYKRILDQYFSKGNRTFIEDRIYGVVEEAFFINGEKGWDEFRLWIYHPEGSIKRSENLDGRASDSKFTDLVF